MNRYGTMQVTAMLMFFAFIACSNAYDITDTNTTTEENVTNSTSEKSVTNSITGENVTNSHSDQNKTGPILLGNIVNTSYKDHGLEGHMLAVDERTGLLIPPKPVSKNEIRTLIVDSKWKDKYCKVRIEYTVFNLVWFDHYCLEKVHLGEESSKFRNVCCVDQVCRCRWTIKDNENKPINCNCYAPNLIQ